MQKNEKKTYNKYPGGVFASNATTDWLYCKKIAKTPYSYMHMYMFMQDIWFAFLFCCHYTSSIFSTYPGHTYIGLLQNSLNVFNFIQFSAAFTAYQCHRCQWKHWSSMFKNYFKCLFDVGCCIKFEFLSKIVMSWWIWKVVCGFFLSFMLTWLQFVVTNWIWVAWEYFLKCPWCCKSYLKNHWGIAIHNDTLELQQIMMSSWIFYDFVNIHRFKFKNLIIFC